MSKISDRLSKLGQTERSGFGFGAPTASTKIPVLLVGVSLDKPGDAKDIEADLYILSTGANGAAQAGPVNDAELWGAAVSGGTAKEIDAATKAGADFIVSEGESAPGEALRDDETGKGFVVEGNVSDDRAKAIDAGPFDFLILDGSNIELPLNVGAVLDIQEQLAKYSRHIFLRVNDVPEQSNLELFRDIGISGFVYSAKSVNGSDLKTLRAAIDQLEPKKQKSNAGAVLPHSGDSNSQDEELEHDHDHDEDWE